MACRPVPSAATDDDGQFVARVVGVCDFMVDEAGVSATGDLKQSQTGHVAIDAIPREQREVVRDGGGRDPGIAHVQLVCEGVTGSPVNPLAVC